MQVYSLCPWASYLISQLFFLDENGKAGHFHASQESEFEIEDEALSKASALQIKIK